MKIKNNLTMRKVGRQYMIVEDSDGTVNFTNVFTLNATAAYLWEQIGDKDFTVDMIVEWLCDRYEVDEEVARNDAETMVDSWKELGLILE